MSLNPSDLPSPMAAEPGVPDLQSRARRAVSDKLEAAFARACAELEEVGETIDLARFFPAVRERLGASFSSPDATREGTVLLHLGADEASSPQLLALERLYWALGAELAAVSERVDQLRSEAEGRLAKWVRKHVPESEARLDPRTLTIVAALPEELRILGLARQVLDYDPERLRQLVESAATSSASAAPFVHDLGTARLSGAAMDRLLRRLWFLENPEQIDEVLRDPAIAQGEFVKPVTYLGELLKRRLLLSLSLRAELDAEVGIPAPSRNP